MNIKKMIKDGKEFSLGGGSTGSEIKQHGEFTNYILNDYISLLKWDIQYPLEKKGVTYEGSGDTRSAKVPLVDMNSLGEFVATMHMVGANEVVTEEAKLVLIGKSYEDVDAIDRSKNVEFTFDINGINLTIDNCPEEHGDTFIMNVTLYFLIIKEA